MRHCPFFASCVRRTSLSYGPLADAYACCASTVATLSPVRVKETSPLSSRPGGSGCAPGPSASTVVDNSGFQVSAASAVRYWRAVR